MKRRMALRRKVKAEARGFCPGLLLVKKVPLDFFAKLLSELQNKYLYHYFAILPLRRGI